MEYIFKPYDYDMMCRCYFEKNYNLNFNKISAIPILLKLALNPNFG